MIEHELLLLGLLREGPKHGYEIKIKIKEILSIFAGVDLKSIYYPLRILERKGLVTKQTGKAGKRPKKFIYKLAPKGESKFEELLTKSLLSFKRPQFSLDLSLYFLHYMNRNTAKRRLRMRMLILKKLSRDLAGMIGDFKKKRAFSLVNILEHDRQMVESESEFLNRLLKTL